MLGFLRSAFGRKPNPQTPGPTTSVRWQLTEPTRVIYFEDEDWAHLWCKQHDVAPHRLEEINKVRDYVQTETERLEFKNLIDAVKHESRVDLRQPLDRPMPSRYLDDFYNAFKTAPQVDATATLLVSAFSVNRIDIAKDIGKRLSDGFDIWANPIEPSMHPDPDEAIRLNNVFLDAFKQLMRHPRELQWLFENNAQLHAKVAQPDHLKRLENHILELTLFDSNSKYQWPAVAHHLFQYNVEPSHQQWDLNSVSTLQLLQVAFSDNPAAQCSLMEQSRFRNWFKQLEPETFGPPNIRGTCRFLLLPDHTQFIAPEAIALMRQFQERPWECDEKIQTRLQLLNLGLDGTTSQAHHVHRHNTSASWDFYRHARAVFHPQPHTQEQLDLPEMELTP